MCSPILQQNDYAMKVVDKDYAMALSLAHSFEILQTHGIWCLYQTLLTAHAQHAPQTSVQGIRQIMARLDRHFSNRDNCPGQSSATAHPKIAALLQVIISQLLVVLVQSNVSLIRTPLIRARRISDSGSTK